MSDFIKKLPDDNYVLLKPIPVYTYCDDYGDWIASMTGANISISGDSYDDAIESLAYYILDSFDFWNKDENVLVNPLKEDLEALRKYIDYKV